jgi:hypothetical protein
MGDEDEFLERVEAELRMGARYTNVIDVLFQLGTSTDSPDVALIRQWARPHIDAVNRLIADRKATLGRSVPPSSPKA